MSGIVIENKEMLDEHSSERVLGRVSVFVLITAGN